MKKARLLFFALIMLCGAGAAFADDYYMPVGQGPYYNPYNGMWVVSLPPPPPMVSVPWYVRDDYDDYLEDYYGCILGYEDWSFTCRYWRKYAEKHNLYSPTPPQQTPAVNGAAPQGAYPAYPGVQAPAAPYPGGQAQAPDAQAANPAAQPQSANAPQTAPVQTGVQ